MDIRQSKMRSRRRRMRRAQRGAALMYALAVVIIISVLLLGVGRLVTVSFQVEETAATYSHLIYSAEAAANWQLQRMSRVVPDIPGAPADGSQPANLTAGHLTAAEIEQSPNVAFGTQLLSPNETGGVQITDQVRVYTTDNPTNGSWQPGHNFYITAFARDPRYPNLQRAVRFAGTATGVWERYSLFGQKSLTFTPIGSSVTTLAYGYIGSNGSISTTSPMPVASADISNGSFSGCLMTGSNSTLNPPVDSWPGRWDMTRLPKPALFPTITQIMAYMFPDKTLNDLASPANNANGRADAIDYVTTDPITHKNTYTSLGAVTALGAAEFDKSDCIDAKSGHHLHVIRLKAILHNPNLFYFTSIQMRSNDVLLLDVDAPLIASGDPTSTACRILLNNDALTADTVLTNIAVNESTDTNILGIGAANFIWYNNTNKQLVFRPTLDPSIESPVYNTALDTTYPQHNTNYPSFVHALTPGIPGLAYGIRTNDATALASADTSGAVLVDATNIPCTVVHAIASQVTLKGNITVGRVVIPDPAIPSGSFTRSEAVEGDADDSRYVFYYRISKPYIETDPGNVGSILDPLLDYGNAPQ